MRRRALITLAAVALASSPLVARAQPVKSARVGVLHVGNADAELFLRELRSGLRELGYVEGRNIRLEPRSTEGKLDRLRELADELVRLEVDVIVAFYTPCALAAKQATSKIPIVMLAGIDPVEAGLADSLARPGRNVTGISLIAAQLHAKSVELLRDMLPSVRRIAFLANTGDPVFAKLMIELAQLAGRSTGIEIRPVMTKIDEIDAAFSTIAREQVDSVVVQATLPTKRIIELAIEHRLPTASISRSFVEVGGLLSYGVDAPVTYRRSAGLVQKILQGKNPAELPIEQPTKFQLAVNQKTAKAIGIEIPETFLSRADAVIE